MVGWLGAVACGGSGAKRAEESARAPSDSEPALGGTPTPISGQVPGKAPCTTTETVASGDNVAVSYSNRKLKVDKQTANDTAHHPRLVDCLILYSDTAHHP